MERERLEKYLTDRINNAISFERKKIAEMQRYIEFGKLSRGIIHDLMNPLNAISLSLEEKDDALRIGTLAFDCVVLANRDKAATSQVANEAVFFHIWLLVENLAIKVRQCFGVLTA
jgi:signal transduction histidine kinase